MTEAPHPGDDGCANAGEQRWCRLGRWLGAAFPWHAASFLALNAGLTVVNVMTGRPWWAVWPLIISGFALALHYFLYRATTVDEEWVAARITELNVKSYDRSHIEDIRERVEKHGYGKQRE